MKRIIKSRIFSFILGGIILGSIGVYAATKYKAEDVSYKNTTVKDALDDLYSKNNDFSNVAYWDFDYATNENGLGKEQQFKIPTTGKYKIETWGAQGGFWRDSPGGYGGYSVGTITLSKNTTLYINVGEKGLINNTSGTRRAYNGGGAGGTGSFGGASGGGATHVALKSGILSSFKQNDTIDNNSIIIVSGAGGGNGANAYAGSGGGISGSNSYILNGLCGAGQSVGATQTTGYEFGQGQDARNQPSKSLSCNTNGSGGGGGGYYGGYSNQNTGANTDDSGAGGSGYIGNSNLKSKHMTCYNCATSDETETKTISNECHNSSPKADCAKEGNGYVRITYLGN